MALISQSKKGRVTMNDLPDEIVLSILSRLTMKEVVRSRLVSPKWDHYSHHIQVLHFEDPFAFYKLFHQGQKTLADYFDILNKGTFEFVYWVNNVLITHLASVVDEFKVFFYLSDIHQHVIDCWVVWAFSKHVKKFELDFIAPQLLCAIRGVGYYYVLDLPILQSCNTKFHLTSLSLKHVDVTTQAMEYFLKTCGTTTLEYLCIEYSNALTSIAATSLPSLKYFELHNCPNVETIHIQAPKLVTFKYYLDGEPLKKVPSFFSVENALALSRVSIHVRDESRFFNILCSLSKTFSHLEYLKLSWLKNNNISPVLYNFPALTSLKHLKLHPILSMNKSLDAWVPVIGACPLLEKLTLQLHGQLPVRPNNVCHDKCPLLCLKTFEIDHYYDNNVDVGVTEFVLQNAPSLQEVIFRISQRMRDYVKLKAQLAALGLKLPPHVNFVIV